MMALLILKVRLMLSKIASLLRKLADWLDPLIMPEWYNLVPLAKVAVEEAEKNLKQGPFKQLAAMRALEKLTEEKTGKRAPRRDINTAIDFAYREMIDANRYSIEKKVSSRDIRLAHSS